MIWPIDLLRRPLAVPVGGFLKGVADIENGGFVEGAADDRGEPEGGLCGRGQHPARRRNGQGGNIPRLFTRRLSSTLT